MGALARDRLDIVEFYIKILGSKYRALQSIEFVIKEGHIPEACGFNKRANVKPFIEKYGEPTLFDILLQKIKILEVKAFLQTRTPVVELDHGKKL
jgi:hypothetical protein